MDGVVPFAETGLGQATTRVLTLCRQHLLERPYRPVPIPTLAWMLDDIDPALVQSALDGLVGSGRVELGLFPQRFRPHVPVLAVVRVDGLRMRTETGIGTDNGTGTAPAIASRQPAPGRPTLTVLQGGSGH